MVVAAVAKVELLTIFHGPGAWELKFKVDIKVLLARHGDSQAPKPRP
jgi:hypothetical protein